VRKICVSSDVNDLFQYRVTLGDASESALLKYFQKRVMSVNECRKQYPKLCEIPFNSANKYQVLSKMQ